MGEFLQTWLKNVLERGWPALTALPFLWAIVEIFKDRLAGIANRLIDENSGPLFDILGPILLGVVSNPLLAALTATIMVFLALIIHAYLETRTARPRPSQQDAAGESRGTAAGAVEALLSAGGLGRPASIGSAFVGRDGKLHDIEAAFAERRVVVISGGPGTGKTRLAAEFTHRLTGPVLWTPGGATLARTLAALAPALHLPTVNLTEEEVAGYVQRKLATLDAQVCLAVDGLESCDLVNELVNAVGSVRLLVTTRDARRALLAPSVAFVSLDVLNPEPARQLLCSRSQHRFDDAILDQISEAVGRLPLALETLSIRLAELSDRLADPQQAPHELLAELGRAPTPVHVAAFQQAAGAAIPRAEGVFSALSGALGGLGNGRKRLSALAYVADAPLPLALFSSLVGADDDADPDRVMDACMKRGLTRASGGGVLIHALTTAAIGATNDPGEQENALLRALTRLQSINTDDPVAVRSEIAHYERMHACFQSALGAEASSALAFATSLAVAYRAVGQNHEALRLNEATLAIRERVQGPEHADTLTIRTNLAIDYAAVGRNDEALQLDEETLAIFQRVLGPEHQDTLRSRNNLGSDYHAVGRNDEALRLHQETRAIRELVLGPEHPDTLSSRNNLAIAYRAVGRNDDALRLDAETLAIRERVLGPEHPHTLGSRNNLADHYRAVGRNGEALRLDEETLAIFQRVLGREHPYTLGSRNNLALSYRAVGRNDDALRLDEQTLVIRERVLGPKHADTLTSRSNLALSYRAVGRHDEALRLHDETLAIRERVLGPEHPDTLGSRNNLAIAYSAVGRNDDALRLHEETLPIYKRVLGPEHPHTLGSRNNLAGDYRAVGRNDDALRLDEETLAMCQRVLGPEHPHTLASRSNLALSYRAVGRNDEALRLDEETLAIRERVLGPEHPDTLRSRRNLDAARLSSSRKPSQSEPVAFLEWLSGLVAGAGGLTLALLFALRLEGQPFSLAAALVALILVASLGVAVGAHRHGSRARPSSLLLLWFSTALAIAAAVLSALSLVLVVFALLALATALLGTWRQVRARALAEPGS